mgnify:CR=1 FL=1
MNYQEFINEYNGKSIDYDGVAGVQCVDLAKMYLDKVFGIKAGAWGNAHAYYDNYNNIAELKNNFDRIANTPNFIPQKGDICVWSVSLNGYGHISIATGEGDTNTFYTYDQNWNGKQMKKVAHNYRCFLGVLRAKDQSKITGITPKPSIQYKVHIENIGWTDWEKAGQVAGTEGEGKRIEAIILNGLNGLDLSYRVHMENLGWSDWVSNGQVAGTTGQSRRIEAIEIKSNKELEVQEHVQNIGWMPGSKGNEIHIGTEGKALRLEAFRINVI